MAPERSARQGVRATADQIARGAQCLRAEPDQIAHGNLRAEPDQIAHGNLRAASDQIARGAPCIRATTLYVNVSLPNCSNSFQAR